MKSRSDEEQKFYDKCVDEASVSGLGALVKMRRAAFIDDESEKIAQIREIAQEALIHTGEPTEGDYLRWQYGGWNAEGKIEQSAEDNMCYMTFTYTYTYYTTYEQETIVDERISEVLDQLDVYDGSAYDKIHAVYDFICQNTVYDYDNLNDDDYKLKYTAYAALIDGKSVCQGYALLVYRMALELGVDSRVISGTGNGGAHGWNIVEINNLYS